MTYFAELAGARILDGRIVIPECGAWHATLTLDGEHAVAPRSSLVVGSLSMTGTPWRPIVPFQGRTGVRLIAGAGGWRNMLEPKPYKLAPGVRLSVVMQDAARTVGETLALSSDRVLGNHYIRERQPAMRMLNRLVPSWYIDAAGITRDGARPSTLIASAFTLASYDGARGVAVVASETLGDWAPGRTFMAPQIGSTLTIRGVIHTIAKGAIRTEVLT